MKFTPQRVGPHGPLTASEARSLVPARRKFELYSGGHRFTDQTTLAEAAAHTRDFPPYYFAKGMCMVMRHPRRYHGAD